MKTLITAVMLAAISTNAMAASFTGSCEYNEEHSYTYIQGGLDGPKLVIDENSDLQSGTLAFEFTTVEGYGDPRYGIRIDTAQITSPIIFTDFVLNNQHTYNSANGTNMYEHMNQFTNYENEQSLSFTMDGPMDVSVGRGGMYGTSSQLSIYFSNDVEDDYIIHKEVVGYAYHDESTYDVITNVGSIRYSGPIQKKTTSSISSCVITEIEG